MDARKHASQVVRYVIAVSGMATVSGVVVVMQWQVAACGGVIQYVDSHMSTCRNTSSMCSESNL